MGNIDGLLAMKEDAAVSALVKLIEAAKAAEARLTLLIDADRHKLLDVVARDEVLAALAGLEGFS